MPYQLVSLYYILHQRYYVLHFIQPTCHPERSGTPGVRANATTEQRRAVEPRLPGGAPAGGISVVPTRPRNAHRLPGTRTRGCCFMWHLLAGGISVVRARLRNAFRPPGTRCAGVGNAWRCLRSAGEAVKLYSITKKEQKIMQKFSIGRAKSFLQKWVISDII